MAVNTTTIIKSAAAAGATVIAAPQSQIAENLAKANWHQLISLQFNFTVSDFIMLGTFFILFLNYLHNRRKSKREEKEKRSIDKSWGDTE